MNFLRPWLLIWFALILGGETIIAASAREDREYAAAAGAFQVGMYDRATNEFAQFVEKYPNSSYVAEAVLLRAQAELKLGKFADSIARLADTNNLAKAGKRADEYFYWTAEAQFESTNYLDAAETWLALAQKFPESRLRLPAVVEAASALTKIPEWRQVVALLEETDGVFQRAAQKKPDDEPVARGKLLLAQAKFELEDFAGASAILEPLLDSKTVKQELRRQGALLLYQVKLAADETEAALAVTTNLLQIARQEKNSDWTAESVDLRGGALKKLGRRSEALAAYQENLTTNAPLEWQHEAVLNIADLAIAQNQFPVATNALEQFLAQFPNSPSADIATLTLAELQLKNYVAQPPATNQLSAVQANFDLFIGTFTNSPLLGKAYLDRGWCNWLAATDAENSGDNQAAAQKYSECFDDFKTAAQKIAAMQPPPSEDLLVAWFKMGDAQFAQGDFAGALENYRAVVDSLKLFPEASATLGDRALYQGVRASVKLNDLADATNMMAQLLEDFPASKLTPGGALLVAESQTDLTPANARKSLEIFEAAFPDSALRPQVELALARTYEREQNWAAAITNYESWLINFPDNDLRPQASYSLAQAYFQAARETNAFGHFTNFVAQFPTNDLAPLAQWWVADHFFRAGAWADAERSYKNIFQNPAWQSSSPANRTNLFYPAQLMAGRAAMARLDYIGANRYFSTLEADTNCPIELGVQATFEHGKALMLSDSTDTNNPLANFGLAITNEFSQILQLNPTNENAARAWFYIGDCHLQLADFGAATNAYAQVFNSPAADISARSQAQIGFGIALEKMAALAIGDDQKTLLELAKENYADVLFTKNLRDDEIADSFWVKKAGLQAAATAETLGKWEEAIGIYTELKKKWLPQLGDLWEKKIADAQAHLPPGKN